jgi:hypothetical protein
MIELLLLWSIIGVYLYFRKYGASDVYPVDTTKMIFYLDILFGGPIVWVLMGIYLLHKND